MSSISEMFKRKKKATPVFENFHHSNELFEESQKLFPGGVNSPVRAFNSVEGNPVFIDKGDGCRITDADGNAYIDFCCSWGPLILGHNHIAVREGVIEAVEKGLSFGAPTRLENELATLMLRHNSYLDKLRFVNSGTEAVMSAIRLARGFTGKNKIIKFEGCYHGHVDSLLVKAGSGLVTLGESSSAGIPEGFVKETLVLPLNDMVALEKCFAEHGDDIAAIIVEPLPANNGLLIQDKDYLQYLRDITLKYKSLLIFDEVISGYRIGAEGAAGFYEIQPDLITYGKIIGGGMPVGAYGGRSDIMAQISPMGAVYQAGTLSGNPVAMAAGLAQLKECLKPGFYDKLEMKTADFVQSIYDFVVERNFPVRIFHLASIFWISFSANDRITRADEISAKDMERFGKFHRELLKRGVYFGPSGYEVGFISEAHTVKDLKIARDVICEALDKAFED